MRSQSLVLWGARVAWAVLPVTAGSALGAAVHDWDTAPRTTATTGLWAVWVVGLVATLVPHPLALTVWRAATPAAVGVVLLAAAGGHTTLLGTAVALVALALSFAPATASSCVNGPAYPNERRFPLRPPGIALIGPAALAWFVLVGAPATAALLLASQRWVLGALVAVIGGGGTVLAARALHGLSRRWLVFVPAGVVIHDPLTLADPVLFPRATIAAVGPAVADDPNPRLDLTAGALGLALEVTLREPAAVLVITRAGRRPTAESVDTSALLVAPTRAADVLADATERGYDLTR